MKFIEFLTLVNWAQRFKKKRYNYHYYRGWTITQFREDCMNIRIPIHPIYFAHLRQVEVKSDGKMRAHLMRLLAAGPVRPGCNGRRFPSQNWYRFGIIEYYMECRFDHHFQGKQFHDFMIRSLMVWNRQRFWIYSCKRHLNTSAVGLLVDISSFLHFFPGKQWKTCGNIPPT